MLILVPPTRRDPLSLVFLRAPRSTLASSFVRRMKLGKIIPRRLSGLSTLPANWRRCNPIGQSSRTPSLPVYRTSPTASGRSLDRGPSWRRCSPCHCPVSDWSRPPVDRTGPPSTGQRGLEGLRRARRRHGDGSRRHLRRCQYRGV